MAVRIAIVEDEKSAARVLEQAIQRYGTENKVSFTIRVWHDPLLFLEEYQAEYDIVYMDIRMPALSGMETARNLRKMDRMVMLIFVTNMAQFAVRGYEVDAFDFLVKPDGYANFALQLQRALSRRDTRRQTQIVINTPDGLIRLPSSQLKYIEISGHRIIYHTTRDLLYGYGNLKQVEAELDGKAFVRCNSCYLVNLNFVSAVRGFTAVVGGDELQISRPKRKAFIQALNDFLGGSIT